MNKRKIALGPGAASLILIVVALSLCMMAMLSIISAKNDYSLCSRSAGMIQQNYELFALSEKRLAELDGILAECPKDAGMEAYLAELEKKLPEDMTLEEDRVMWQEPLENRMLECEVQIQPPEEKTRTRWISHKLTVIEPEEDWEW